MNDATKGRRSAGEIPPSDISLNDTVERDLLLAQIADLLNVPVSRFAEDIPENAEELLEQCALMHRLFARIQSPATRSRLIATAREALREEVSEP